MKHWVPINQGTLDLGRDETIRGVHVRVSSSPYDIPRAIRGYYCDDLGKFVIEFRYIEDEPLTKIKADDFTWFEKGSFTGRIYKISIDVDEASAEQVSLVVEEHNHDDVSRVIVDSPMASTAIFENTFERMRNTVDNLIKSKRETDNSRAISAALGQSHESLKESFQKIEN